MSERKAGWYWVRARGHDEWLAVEYDGRKWVVGAIDVQSDVEEIGPRIPTPDEPWQCVPVKATIEMMTSADDHLDGMMYEDTWKALLAASPKPEDT